MTTTYSVYLSDPFGIRIADASDFLSLQYSRVVNGIGQLTLELAGNFPQQYIRIPDGRIEVWRRIDGGREYLDTDTVWLIQKIRTHRDAKGTKTLIIEADTPLCIFREPGRVALGVAGSSPVTFTAAAADNQIKDVARNAITTASLSSALQRNNSVITIAPNTSQGASVAKAFAFRECLTVMQEFAQASTTNGTYIAFDVVSQTPDTMTFQTFAQQRGVDHRFPGGNNPVFLSADFGNVGEANMALDYRDMASAVVTGGAGQGAQRVITRSQDLTLQGISPFGYREKFFEYTNTADTASLQAEGDAELRASRPRLTYSGKILDTNDTRYGVHWGWGDYVTVQDFGRSFDCRIEAITVTVRPGDSYETVEAWLRSETYYV